MASHTTDSELNGLPTSALATTSAVKHKRSFTMDQFTVTQGTGANKEYVLTQCNHCKVCISQRKGILGRPGTTNPTRCGEHIDACMACPEDIRTKSAASLGNSAKKAKISSASVQPGANATDIPPQVHVVKAPAANSKAIPRASTVSSTASETRVEIPNAGNAPDGQSANTFATPSAIKHKRTVTMDQFTVTQGTGVNRDFVLTQCNHCNVCISQRRGTLGKSGTTNPTRCGEHIDACVACPEDIKKQSAASSGKTTKKVKISSVSTLSGVNATDIQPLVQAPAAKSKAIPRASTTLATAPESTVEVPPTANALNGQSTYTLGTAGAVKHKRSFTMDQFTVTQGTGVNKEYVLTQCDHCNVCISQRKGILGRPGTTNPTRCGEHIDACMACPEDIRTKSAASLGNSAKKAKISSASVQPGANAMKTLLFVDAPAANSKATPRASTTSATTSETSVEVPSTGNALDGQSAITGDALNGQFTNTSGTANAIKHKRSFTMDQFTVTQGTGVNKEYVLTRCNHCNVCISQRKGILGRPGTTNPTRCGEHIDACMACPEDVRILSAASSGKSAEKGLMSSASATIGDSATNTQPSVKLLATTPPANPRRPGDSPTASETSIQSPTAANVLDENSANTSAITGTLKHRRTFTMDQFRVTQGTGVNRDYVLTQCKHCNVCISQRKGTLGKSGTTNPTRCGEHIDACMACPEDVKQQSAASSGKAAKNALSSSAGSPAAGPTAASTASTEVLDALSTALSSSSNTSAANSNSNSTAMNSLKKNKDWI